MAIRVLTVDDHAVVRAGIAAMLANEPDMAVVGDARDGREAVARYVELRPDVVLMDLRMPDLDGVAATRAIRAADPGARVIGRATGTVKVHVKNIFAKLGVEDRTEAVTLALQRGIIHLDD